ncbi:hypothetical protein GCM10007939_20750 [Amylibacter marinus]|uniref:Malonyl-[acyl-carrier protein] O-methyltransferase n=1 Tax=Amylibacter marinus TaxID=1475483 RepID=A0ABQ5VX62_9RHOB|nr:methyltransferase domain-containing protein [Amylibacter marinus]GLQ35792.1 hypothetical protein GCM10007939_20750 [Amylibacter marinus]
MSRPLDPRRIAQSFARGLNSYERRAVAQRAIAQRLAQMLAAQPECPKHLAHVLELGAGTGFLTQAVSDQFSVDRWLINDLVPAARDHIAPILAGEQWRFSVGAIEDQVLAGPFDLIAGASVVQWVADTRGLLDQMHRALAPRGWLALSSFGPDHFHQLRALRGAAGMHYHSVDQWRAFLGAGYEVLAIETEERVLTFDSLRALLVHLRETGVNAPSTVPWSRRRLAEFEREYGARFGDGSGRLPLSYAPIYIVARRR